MAILRQLLILLVLAGIGYGGWYGYQQYIAGTQEFGAAAPKRAGGNRATPVKTTTAEQRTLVRQLEVVGSTRALQVIDIKPKADGTIVEIVYEAGKRLNKDDVLFRLDDAIQRADLAEAKASLAKAEQALARGRTLKQSRVVATATLEDLEAARAAAQAQVDRATQRLADRTIRAPFAGTPSIRRVDLGAQVSSDTVLTRLENLSPMLVEFQVPEQFFSIARPGLAAEATTPAWPGKSFTASLSEIDTSIDPVSRTFRVRAQMPNEDGALASGMFMRLSLQLSSDGVVMIPEQSITMEEGTPFVFVFKDGKVERRDVKTGGREPGWVQITNGLTLGEEIVVSGISKVRPGGAVKVVNAEKAADAGAAAATAAPKPAGSAQ
jgi:membrane fusion protein (multidrug efflux system)